MSFGGVLDGRTVFGGAYPNPPAFGATTAADPRDRTLGAALYTTGGGVGAQQAGAPYVGTGGTTPLATHSLLLVLVVAELVALVALRHTFRHYHGG